MNTRTLKRAAAGLLAAGALLACSTPEKTTANLATTATKPCDIKDEACVSAALLGAANFLSNVGQACGPSAGCGSPPGVVFPRGRVPISPAERAHLARGVLMLFQAGGLTQTDLDIAAQSAGIRPH